jgi:hypothetical protein
MYIEILLALQPEIFDISTEYFSDGECSGYILNVTGSSLVPDSEYTVFYFDGTAAVPVLYEYLDDGHVRLFVEGEKINLGEYELFVRNPGGLRTMLEKGDFDRYPLREQEPPAFLKPAQKNELKPVPKPEPVPVIAEHQPDIVPAPEAEQKLLEKLPGFLNISLAWMPVIPIYGDNYKENIYPGGAAGRLNMVFLTGLNFYLGPELTFSWFSADLNHLFTAGINLSIIKWSPDKKIAFGLRGGPLFHLFSSGDEDISIYLNLGVSFHWRITKILLFDVGIDYSHLFDDSKSGVLRPWAGMGFIF